MNPDGSNGVHLLSDFYDLQGRRLAVAHPNSWMVLEVPFATFPLQVIRTRVTGQTT